MSLPGETIADGAAPRCEDCGQMPKLDVYASAAPATTSARSAPAGRTPASRATTARASSPRPTSTPVPTDGEVRGYSAGAVKPEKTTVSVHATAAASQPRASVSFFVIASAGGVAPRSR